MRITTETIVGFFMASAFTVFLFMSFKIGVWRFDTVKYAHYITYFTDVSGLNEKADIVIAGVKVGWVQRLSLVPRSGQVRIDMMIERNSQLHTDSYGLIRQNGLLGTKYVEIIPGDSILPILPPGSTLMKPSVPPVAIDELLATFKEIANNVNHVSIALKDIVAGEENTQSIKNVIYNASRAFETIEKTADSLHVRLNQNSQKFDSIVDSMHEITYSLRTQIPGTMDSIRQTSETLKVNIDNLSNSIDQAIHPLAQTMQKIDDGKGVLGALVNDEKLLKEVKSTVHGVKDYFDYIDRLGIDFDLYFESMQGRGDDLDFKDSKGYFNVLVRPNDDFYYLLGLSSSYNGIVKRYRTDNKWYDQQKQELIPQYMHLEDFAKLWYAPVKEEYVRHYDAATLNLQCAKVIGRLGVRTGIFESTFGVGADYDVPLATDSTRWITTVEAFRFNQFLSQTLDGKVTYSVDRPHLKWLNRVFVNDSTYVTFGADDFISKYNKNFFVGMGLTFENDEVKYLASKVSFPS